MSGQTGETIPRLMVVGRAWIQNYAHHIGFVPDQPGGDWMTIAEMPQCPVCRRTQRVDSLQGTRCRYCMALVAAKL